MTEDEAIRAIDNAFAAGWAIEQPSIPLIVFDNEAAKSTDTFVDLTIKHSPISKVMTMGPPGTKLVQHFGTIYVRMFVPVDVGRAGVALLAKSVSKILQCKDLTTPGADGPVSTFAASPREMGKIQDRWWASARQIPFWYVETGV